MRSRRPTSSPRWIVISLGIAASMTALAAQAGPIFFPGRLEPGKFLPDETVTGSCYSVRYGTVNTTVEDGVATTTIRETIVGPEAPIKTVCLIPLPLGTDGRDVMVAVGIPNSEHLLMEAEFLGPDAAQKVYEILARDADSVDVLSLTGKPAVLIPEFELKGTIEMVVEFEQQVVDQQGVWTIECPMPSTAWADGPALRVSMAATIRSREPLRATYSPTHQATITRPGPYEAKIRAGAENWAGGGDFRVCWTAEPADPSGRIVARLPADGDNVRVLLRPVVQLAAAIAR